MHLRHVSAFHLADDFIIIITMAVITYISTFIGFISLNGKVFPIMGLFGFTLPVLYKGLIKRITGKSHID